MDVDPLASAETPASVTPSVRATLPENVRGAVPAATDPDPMAVSLPADPGPEVPVPPEPVSLDHPTVVDTATFQAGSTVVALFGIEGVKGDSAEGLQGFLTSHGNRITCQAQSNIDFVCLQPDGTDVAEVALINGAARAKVDAPDSYRNQELAAQAARRGIWANLPPPPVIIRHPEVRDTATLVSDGQAYVLDGLQGLGPPFTAQLQAYIAQHGDSLTCDPQSLPGHYVCLLSDSTDIAKAALVNGAAQVSPDAPDTYRMQQADALKNRRGFWQSQPQGVLPASTTVTEPAPCCAFVAGDEGVDGIAYVAGVPTAEIGGETVFITYIGDAGWGYYDHWHHWRPAPARYWSHLEHYHPYGHGLRGYGHEEGFRHEAALHKGMRPGVGGAGIRPGIAGPGYRSAMVEPAMRPGVGGPGFHPGGAVPGFHPGAAAPGFHPGMAAPGFHPGMGAPGVMHSPAPGAGFVHPGPSAAGFHPGGFAPAAHMASAPAIHASPSAVGGVRKH